ncbi:hypothetical protein J2Z48_003064 [Croceifilum oryzae]|uniref:DoxX-like family protein n=1 Tax=Croceifilum oryzae TaxID=1553429 RepID=A0AAJ1TI03_9BACL|nr:DoxX-like family protein [Croceifilum oryzae]MDQ0418859.1 hypothetical protein [Croceifilum oryzae]
MKNTPIYVEISIDSDIEEVWKATQEPHLHEQWDLRFSSISYLPRVDDQPQEFTYCTNIGFGMKVEGWGRSVGEFHSEDGSRTSSLHFGTEQAISIIREGKGYWKYQPQPESVLFLTQYDYQVNFGRLGSWFDRLIFRPMIGWATALSFDVLKRWIEKGENPASQFIRFFSYWLMTILFSGIWIFHGLGPKIYAMHPAEISMMRDAFPMDLSTAKDMLISMGILEVSLGLCWILYKKRKNLFRLQVLLFPLFILELFIANPSYMIHPFSPLTFQLSLWVLSLIGLWISHDVPTASSCKRRRTG